MRAVLIAAWLVASGADWGQTPDPTPITGAVTYPDGGCWASHADCALPSSGPVTLRYIACSDICAERHVQYATAEECDAAMDKLPLDADGFAPILIVCQPTPKGEAK